ncbi:DeoR/GlpR family DNA-binding transcription regulator [Clostridiaceae bacterium 35-E11]
MQHLSAEERKERILYELNNYGKVMVKQLAEQFGVTMETIRRDLDFLEIQCQLKRIHGGAIKISYDKTEPSHTQRRDVFREEKQKIGHRAANFINDDEVIAIDTGTTTCEILYHLKDKKNITVILNNIAALNIIMDLKNKGLFHGKILFLGGEINTDQLSSFGPMSEKMMGDFYVDKAFIAVGGMSLKHGLTSYDMNEASLTQKIMENAKEVVVVADHSKIGVRNFYKICEIEETHMIVSDENPPKEWEEFLGKNEMKWIKA